MTLWKSSRFGINKGLQQVGVLDSLVLEPFGNSASAVAIKERISSKLIGSHVSANDYSRQPVDSTGDIPITHQDSLSMCRHAHEQAKQAFAEAEDLAAFEAVQGPGALLTQAVDVVVADEGHEIKNRMTQVARALMQIQTKRRLALTGYPLQNKLTEYYTMVNWVRQDLLDDERAFKETFVAPITKGQPYSSEGVPGRHWFRA